jgi:hypothetical protein
MPGPPPAAGVVEGADFVLLDELVLLAAAGAAAAVLLLIELLLDELLDELLADLLTPLWPRQAPLVVETDCVVPSLHVTVMLPPEDDDVLLLVVLELLAAAGAAAEVLLLLEVLLDEPLADLLTPLCPRHAPFVVVTVCEVPSLHVTVMLLPLDAADCACAPGAVIITAAAITAINPNDFIEIPSS